MFAMPSRAERPGEEESATVERPMKYVLITPARNEEAFIEKTIRSVVSQSVLPARWVIVSDGSTDRTDEIVKRYLPENPWMQLVRMPERRDRHFGGKVQCFNAGYEKLGDLDYDVIGNLDADISFESGYFEFLLDRFAENPKLGVAGTRYVEKDHDSVEDTFAGESYVNGPAQIFRRRCFEEIGGYVPSRRGGIDVIAVTAARMKGWETRAFREKYYYNHRPSGTAESNRLKSSFKNGVKDYILGGHPLWELFRIAYRLGKKPYLVMGIGLMSGYLWAFATRVPRPVSSELMRFHRREQMEKLRYIVRSVLHFRKVDKFKLSSQ